MKVYYTKCRSCGESMRTNAKVCIHCGKHARPLPAFLFSFLSIMFVTYMVLDTYKML